MVNLGTDALDRKNNVLFVISGPENPWERIFSKIENFGKNQYTYPGNTRFITLPVDKYDGTKKSPTIYNQIVN